jgi:hypothetical protein
MAGSTAVVAGRDGALRFREGPAAPGLRNLLPPLTSDRFLHVHENRLHHRTKYGQIFILVKIGRNGAARNGCHA